MRARLFVHLNRDAIVPGVRCAWILRDFRGAELRRGNDALSGLPQAAETVGVLAYDLLVSRAISLPPGRRARTPVALANAMEPFMLSEASNNYVVVLGEAGDATTVLAAITRAWIDPCLAALARSGHALSRLIVETSLPKREDRVWVAVCTPEGGFLRLDDERTIGLDHAPDGGVPEGIKWQVQSSARDPARRLRVYHAGSLDRGMWQSALAMPVEDAGRWDWAQLTGIDTSFSLRAAPDLLAAIQREAAGTEPAVRHWRTPALLALAILGVHVAASTVLWSIRAAERASLQVEIHTQFRKAVAPSEPLVDAVLQTRRALGAAQRVAGHYSSDDFVTLLGRFATESAGLPANSVRTIQFSAGALSVDLQGIPAQRLERLVEQLRGHGLRVENRSSGAQSQLTLRAEP